ncbi:peptidoglycan-binding protein [Actinomadura sp. NBRC 104412]|uniref:peptidoglycan-binding protein n=1 Tax=Actinomadura sp. NBRC 104412 TaxID=3032203 RepID=UPI0025560A6E|nr:peptidoglycan-binding protein [Actinomadura sp. NBRC 104412]
MLAIGAAVTVVAGGGAAFALIGDDGDARAQGGNVELSTAAITKGDLVDTEKVDGTLTFEGERDVWVGASGVVTWAPSQGAVIERGDPLVRVQNRPVTLMYGGTPMYRAIGSGVSDGADVKALESNLKALGYGGDLTVDDEFTAATEAAIREWQDDRGLEETGRVDDKQVVFLPGAVRVKTVKAPEGKRVAPGQPVMTVAGTRRIVHIDLDADKQDMAVKGARVSVELPGGKVVAGRIASVGTVAEETGTEQNPRTTVDVEITLDRNADTGRLDQAPVTVELESERREGVLSVPIEALLGLREGGFGVEVVEGAGRRIVPVTTGAFGGGRVEISGPGLAAGMKVGVPAGE